MSFVVFFAMSFFPNVPKKPVLKLSQNPGKGAVAGGHKHKKKYLLVHFEAASAREMLTFLRDSLLGMVVVV